MTNPIVPHVVEIPVAPAPVREDAHRPLHVQVRLKTKAQRTAMRRLYEGLDQTGARMANGRRVHSLADAMRWVLERLEPTEPAVTA